MRPEPCDIGVMMFLLKLCLIVFTFASVALGSSPPNEGLDDQGKIKRFSAIRIFPYDHSVSASVSDRSAYLRGVPVYDKDAHDAFSPPAAYDGFGKYKDSFGFTADNTFKEKKFYILNFCRNWY